MSILAAKPKQSSGAKRSMGGVGKEHSFTQMVLYNTKSAGDSGKHTSTVKTGSEEGHTFGTTMFLDADTQEGRKERRRNLIFSI